MRGHNARQVFVGILLSATCLVASPSGAQDAGEPLSGQESGWIGVPPPQDCRVDPISVDDYVAALATTTPESFDGELSIQIPSEDDLPDGKPADDDIVEGISATLWESTACLNGGDFARFLALMTPSGVQFFLMSILEQLGREPGPFTDEELSQYEANFANLIEEEPEPFPVDERSSIDEMKTVRVLPDDRVLAVVDGRIGDVEKIYAVFTLDDDRWLIDILGVIGDLPDILF